MRLALILSAASALAASALECDLHAPTLAAARAAVRASPAFRISPLTACVDGGSSEGAIVFDDSDSGTASAPVTYIATGASIITGAIRVQLTPLAPDDPIRAYVPAAVAAALVGASLPAFNVTDFGRARTDGGCTYGCGTGPLQLLVGDGTAVPARWPNADPTAYGGPWAMTSLSPDKRHTSGWFFWDPASPGVGLWQAPPDITTWPDTVGLDAHGYWWWDWDDYHQPISGVVVSGTTPTTLQFFTPGDRGNLTSDARFYFTNHASLLDAPGEVHLNSTTGMLYYYPSPEDDLSTARVSVADVVVNATGTAHVTLQGFTIEGARANGFNGLGCSAVALVNCTVRHVGSVAVTFYASNGSTVEGAHVYNTGGGGVHFGGGGDRGTLTPSGNAVRNSHVHHFERQCLTYSDGLSIDTGGVMEHNEVHDSGHSCATLNGNDVLVQYNIFHHCTMDTFDNAAFYWFPGDWTAWNVTHRYNLFHSNGGGNSTCNENTQNFRASLYMDNAGAGWSAYGNVLWQPEWPEVPCGTCKGPGTQNRVAINNDGGRSSGIFNNIIVDANATYNSGGMLTWDVNGQVNTSTYYEKMREVGWDTGVYAARYPPLAALHDYYTPSCAEDPACPAAPWGNTFVTNVLVNVSTVMEYPPPNTLFNASGFNVTNNLVTQDPGWADPDPRASLNFQLAPTSPAYALGFVRIPMECFGMCACGSCG